MPINRCKKYANTEKSIEVHKRFMAFLEHNYVIALTIHNVYFLLFIAGIWNQLSAIHNTTKHTPYFSWSHKEKSNCLDQMNICNLRQIM